MYAPTPELQLHLLVLVPENLRQLLRADTHEGLEVPLLTWLMALYWPFQEIQKTGLRCAVISELVLQPGQKT